MLRMSEHTVLGPNREDVAGGWRQVHNEELHNL
jgi:hypothetical protein